MDEIYNKYFELINPAKETLAEKRQKLKEKFANEGKTFAGWSKENGVRYTTTMAVINGVNKGNYGEAHRVAVALGLKEGN